MEDGFANLSLAEGSKLQEGFKTEASSPARTGSASSDAPDTATKDRFMELITKAREYASSGNIERAIRLNEKAIELRYSEKLEKRINKMKVCVLGIRKTFN